MTINSIMLEACAKLESKHGIKMVPAAGRGEVTINNFAGDRWTFKCAQSPIEFPMSYRTGLADDLLEVQIGHYTLTSTVDGGFTAEDLEAALERCFNLLG